MPRPGDPHPVVHHRAVRTEPPVPGPRLAAARVPGVADEVWTGGRGEAHPGLAPGTRLQRGARDEGARGRGELGLVASWTAAQY